MQRKHAASVARLCASRVAVQIAPPAQLGFFVLFPRHTADSAAMWFMTCTARMPFTGSSAF
jgi:hypothetical protein